MNNFLRLYNRIIYSTTISIRRPPSNLKKEDEYQFKHEYTKLIPSSRIQYLKNAIVNSNGVVFYRFHLFKESLRVQENLNYKDLIKILKGIFISKKTKLNKNQIYILAFYSWSNNYFHCVTEFFNKFVEIEKELKDATLIIPYYCNIGFHKQFLKLFEIPNIYYLKESELVKVKNLLWISDIAISGNYNELNLNKFRDYIIGKVDCDRMTSLGDRIYISRRKAQWRYVINEQEVEKLLLEYKFKVIQYEDFDLYEQISIAYKAKILVGIVGANLTNILFMQKGSKVLELRKREDSHNNCYYSLANSSQLDFYYQNCEYEDTRKGDYFNLIVDIIELKKNIELMISKE